MYELMGDLVGNAGTVLESGEIAGRDEHSQRELRQVGLLLKRVAVMWPRLFSSLWEENAALAATLTEVQSRIEQHGLVQDRLTADPDDPIVRNQQLLRALNEAEATLLGHPNESWAIEARRVLRHGLTDAIAAQGEMVEAAWRL